MSERPHLRTKLVLDIPTVKRILDTYLTANGYEPVSGRFEHEKTTSGYRVSAYEAEVRMPLPYPRFPALPDGRVVSDPAQVFDAEVVDS